MKRVAVIGAGIVGASIAFHLARRGAHVTVLDAGQPGQGASRVSFAWINGRDKFPRGYQALNYRSQQMWRGFVERLDADVGLTWGGEMRWAATGRGAREMRARVSELQSWGYPIRLLSPDEAADMEPGIRFGDIILASYTGSDGHVDPVRVAEACVQRVREMGGEVVLGAAVAGIAKSRGRVRAVTTDDGEYACDAVVVAAGAATNDVAAMAGVDVPTSRSPGATVVTSPLQRPLFARICAVHTPRDMDGVLLNVRQLTDGRVMVHGGTHAGSIADESLEDAAMLLQEAARWLPAMDGLEVSEVRRAMRPMPADGHPVLGFTHAVPSLYLALTHSGVTLAPLIGELAAIEIIDGVRVADLAHYRVERFAR